MTLTKITRLEFSVYRRWGGSKKILFNISSFHVSEKQSEESAIGKILKDFELSDGKTLN